MLPLRLPSARINTCLYFSSLKEIPGQKVAILSYIDPLVAVIISVTILSEELTKKQVMLLINKIVVHEDTGIDIYLKGDLHKICNNYFRVSESKRDKIKRLTYDFIMQNPKKFITNDGAIYIRERGIKISYKTFSD